MNQYDVNIESNRKMTHVTNINQNPYINQNVNYNNSQNAKQNNQSGLTPGGFNQGDFLKGALIGAAVTYLLTNKGAQEKLMGAASKANELFQAGMEEVKERYEDARAQMGSK